MKNMRVASVQFQHAPGDKRFNLNKVRAFVERAAARGVELIAPEMCITGYWHVRNLPREGADALAEPVPAGRGTRARCGSRAEAPSSCRHQPTTC